MKDEGIRKIEELIKNKNYTKAKNFLSEACDKQENDINYLYYKAHILRKLGNLEKAEEEIKKAIKLNPKQRSIVFELGIIFQHQGDYKKAIKFLERAASAEGGEVSFKEQIDILNSLGLTYKKMGDIDNALQRYNIALELLAQRIYEKIKDMPLQKIGLDHTQISSDEWIDIAFQIAYKNGAKEGIKKIMTPSGETASKFIKENNIVGTAIHDENGVRYLLPPYFEAFSDSLKSNLLYPSIMNNIGVLFAENGNKEKAKKYFEESIEFIPEDIDYPNPRLGLKELE